ncbi:heat shock 70 kDa protein 4L isoform X1 [Lepeophtheirus salmonis]|uniref:heat shock 70 kDa protein 4L isoform X1 n=2 Tax=Lepeophtheirus salmonis TaxID=72036 RepID=UPI003AF3F166
MNFNHLMSVVGIDFGNENCYISVARAGGIESIANDYSMRDTPSYVAFGDKQRLMGVAAKSQHLTNLKKTFFGFKPLIGRKFKDPIVQNELKRIPYPVSEDPETGNVLLHVDYLGKSHSFTPKQVTSMLFTKLKHTAEAALNTKVKDVVISVPTYYTDCERRCILDAANMADLNVLKLMNDTTATALAYGIYKQDLPPPEEKARNVIFVDVGHRGAQAAACSFNKGKLSMVCNTFDANLGGRNLNENIARYFADGFKKSYKIDVYSSPKAMIKLITEVEKLKKQMSANTNKLPLNIECFMDDKDVKGYIDRTTFEEISQVEISRMEKILTDCLAQSKWKKEDIYSVEIVGGSTRVPFVKTAMERVFGKVPNTTLNADEAVSRGCALQCAILSPTFKVREFSVLDSQPYPILLKWQTGADIGEMEVFSKFQSIPFSKMLTFWQPDNFKLVVEYAGKDVTMNPHIGEFEISVTPKPDGSNTKVKVKARINLNGIFAIVSATKSEKHEIEEEVQMEVEEEKKPASANSGDKATNNTTSEDVNMDEPNEKATTEDKKDEKTPTSPPKMEKQKKIITKIIDLPVCSRVVGSLTDEGLTNLSSIERNFVKQDQMESDRLTYKNAVEEYVYDIRSKIHGDLSEFITDEDRGKYSNELEDSENWLYEDGEDVEKKVYVEKLNHLQVVGEALKRRKYEFDQRPHAFNTLGHCLNMATKVIDAFRSGDEKYNHLDTEAVNKVNNMIIEKNKWLSSSIHTLKDLDKTSDPSILVSYFYEEKKNFEAFAHPILHKAKPKVEPPPPPPTTQPNPEDDKTKNNAADNNTEGGDNSTSGMGEGAPPKPNKKNVGEEAAQTMAVD